MVRQQGSPEEAKESVKVIFTCGGTAGHINPAISVANLLKSRKPDTEILFVGAEDGMENRLVPKEGYRLETLRISNYQRKLTPKAVWHNLKTLKNIRGALKKADRIIREFRPDVIVGTGGYASYPIVRYGAEAGIPTAVHESNIVPGLTTKQLEPYADRIMVGFEDCRAHYRHPERVVVTGTPVRSDFFALTKQQAKQKLGVDDGRPLIVSFWGSLGAGHMNGMMADFLALEAAKEPFHHVHGVGSISWAAMQKELAGRGVELAAHPALDVREYIYDMADVMRAADLVLARAGASTIAELTALGVPAILVPSPNVTNHHQEKNANVLGAHGAALVLAEEGLDGKKLFAAAADVLHDDARRAEMERNMAALGVRDATERIYETVMALVR